MPNELEELPLFPLNAVLFPHASLRLHVFEDRYRELIRRCVREDRPFGVVLIRSGPEVGSGSIDPYLVGTAVRILQVDTFDDGRMDVQVIGERRFRIRDMDDETSPFLVGRVEPVLEHELDDSAHAQEVIARAREEFEILVQRLLERQEFAVRVVYSSDPVALSFTIANLLPLENLEKQRLLETTDTLERLDTLLPVLEAQMLEAGTAQVWRVGSDEMKDWIVPN